MKKELAQKWMLLISLRHQQEYVEVCQLKESDIDREIHSRMSEALRTAADLLDKETNE